MTRPLFRLLSASLPVLLLLACSEPPPPVEEEVPRPVKTLLIEAPESSGVRNFPARIDAHRKAELAFRVAGKVQELLALTESPVLTAELRQDMANFVAVLSLFVSVIWFLTVHSLRPLAQEQRTVIMEMDRSTPFDFMTRLTRLQEREAGWLQSGRIEAIVPLAMTVPALTMLYLINAN